MPPVPSRFERIWDDVITDATEDDIHDRTGYSHREILQGHLEVFFAFPGMTEEERSDQYNFWAAYLISMVQGSTQARREEFFNQVGLTHSTFNWAQWRAVMGYERT